MADLRLAVMQRQLLRRDDVLAVGPRVVGVAIGVIEGIHDQCPVDLDRLFILGLVEHQPPAEAADRRLARLGQDRIVPEAGDLLRLARLVFLVEGPERPAVAVGGRRSAGGQQQPGQQAADEVRSRSAVRFRHGMSSFRKVNDTRRLSWRWSLDRWEFRRTAFPGRLEIGCQSTAAPTDSRRAGSVRRAVGSCTTLPAVR